MLRISCVRLKPGKISDHNANIKLLQFRILKLRPRLFYSSSSCLGLNDETETLKSDPTFHTNKTQKSTRNDPEANHADYFGILDGAQESQQNITNPTTPKVNIETLKKKYTFMQKRKVGQELQVAAPFGTVRLDDQALKEKEVLAQVSSRIYDNKYDEQTDPETQESNMTCRKSDYVTEIIKDSSVSRVPNTRINQQYLTKLKSSNKNEKINSENVESNVESESSSIFDEQYFGDYSSTFKESTYTSDQNITKTVPESFDKDNTTDFQKQKIHSEDSHNEFDKEYFSERLSSDHVKSEVQPRKSTRSSTGTKFEPSNYFDEVYFENLSKEKSEYESLLNNIGSSDTTNFKAEHVNSTNLELDPELSSSKDMSGSNLSGSEDTLIDSAELNFHEMKPDNLGQLITKQKKRLINKLKPNVEEPQTAYDYAMKVRKELRTKPEDQQERTPVNKPFTGKWSGKVDSKGFKLLQSQVMDFTYQQEDIVAKILKDSIIYNEGGIIAIDKPYGLPSHGGPGVHHSIAKLLPKLAKLIDRNLDTLHMVHRLDKETTGVMMLAKDEATAERLHGMFVRREVVKRYWVITKGVPNPPTGVIDIPMAEGTVAGKYRMCLRPLRSEVTRPMINKNNENYQAVTKYEVLDENHMCALVELEPATGVKHQIRCHLAFGMNTPILGDHKYSHFSKIAPQKLHPETLQRLGIRQAKVRHLPMHLHAKSIVLPQFLDGRNFFLTTRLPTHFVQNMKWLKLKPPPSR